MLQRTLPGAVFKTCGNHERIILMKQSVLYRFNADARIVNILCNTMVTPVLYTTPF